MLTDFKFSRVTRHDDGTTTAVLRIYEGAIGPVDIRNDIGAVTGQKMEYQRSKLVSEKTVTFADGTNDDDVRAYGRKLLAGDKTRTAIDTQKVRANDAPPFAL